MAIDSPENLQKWLRRKPQEVAVAIAVRAALRATPMAVREIPPRGGRKRQESFVRVTAAIFRATALARAAVNYPDRTNELASIATVAEYASSAAYAATYGSRAAFAAGSSIRAAASGAAHATYASRAATHASRAATSAVWREIALDVEALDDDATPSEVLAAPLWRDGTPDWALLNLQRMKDALSHEDGWQVWFDWYRRMLDGAQTSEDYDLAFVPPDEEWEKGPAAANAWVKEHLPKPQTSDSDLAQRPAAYSFRVVDNRFDVAPEDGKSIDAETTQELYEEAKANALDLKERLARAQVDEKVRAHVDSLIKHLGNSLADVRIGTLLRSLRGLESDLHAYSSEEARRELFPDALSLLANVTANVRDVLSTLPKWREIEAESVLLQMPFERLPEIEAEARSVAESILLSDCVTDAAKEAIADSAEAVVDARSEADRAKQDAYLLLDLGNFVRAGIQHVRASGGKIARPVRDAAKVAGRELGGLAGDTWKGIRRGLPKGVERGAQQVGKALVIGGVSALMGAIAGPIVALGTFVGGYLPLGKGIESITEQPSADATQLPDESAAAAEPNVKAPAKKAAKKRSGKSKK